MDRAEILGLNGPFWEYRACCSISTICRPIRHFCTSWCATWRPSSSTVTARSSGSRRSSKSSSGCSSGDAPNASIRSEEHTSELQSLMRISYAVFCLQKKQITTAKDTTQPTDITSLLDNDHVTKR